MRMRRLAAWATLLVAALVAGCAVRPGEVDPAHAELGLAPDVIKKPSTMSADELRDVQAQPVDEQRRRLDVVLGAHPDDLNARFLRVQAEFKLGDVAAVVSDSGLVLANPSLAPHLRQLALGWRAEALINLLRFDEASTAADQALQIEAADNLNLALALGARGWARFFNHQYDDALADIDHAIQADPSEGILYYRRAQVFNAQAKVDRAAADFERAIELAPDDGPGHREYGVLLYRTHDLERALAQFDAGVKSMPGDPLVLTWRAQANLALGRLDAAAADDHRIDALGLEKAEQAQAFNNVGSNLSDLHDFAGAAREFGRSLALKSDAPVAATLARMQWFSGQFVQALNTCREFGVSPIWSSDYKPIALYVLRGRANPAGESAARVELASTAPHQPHVWTDTLVSLLLGRTTLDAALAEADAGETPRLRAGRRCEADYYAAEQLLMRDDVAPASRLLAEAGSACPSNYFEVDAVVAERRLIVARSTTH